MFARKEYEASENQEDKDTNKSSMIKILLIIVTILITSILAGCGTFFWQQQELQREKSASSKEISSLQRQVVELRSNESLNPSEASDWITYYNKQYNYSIKYPKNWQLSEERNASSITISRNDKTFGESGDYWLQINVIRNVKSDWPGIDMGQLSETTISDLKVKRRDVAVTPQAPAGIDYYIKDDVTGFMISLTYNKPSDNTGEKIISTFKLHR